MFSEHATLSAAFLLNGLADFIHGLEGATLSLSAAADALTLTLRQGVCREVTHTLIEALLVDGHGKLDHHALHDIFFLASAAASERHSLCD
jgi:hypothetical protein